jgi:hypothetical protein
MCIDTGRSDGQTHTPLATLHFVLTSVFTISYEPTASKMAKFVTWPT